MQKLNLLTYADDLYEPMQKKLVAHAKSLYIFDDIYTKNRSELIQTQFYLDNKTILDTEKGGGLCFWKPYYILETLNRMNEGDILLYMDSADWLHNTESFRKKFLEKMQSNDVLLTAGAFPNRQYTKRDVFVCMFADEPKYWDAIQLEAGVVVVKNTEWSREFIAEWLKWCQVQAVITDDPNICNLPNFPEFIDIRYDQSVLSILQIKNNITPSDFIRKFITCNVNIPE